MMNDYATNDPIFSNHGKLYNMPYIRYDMLMLENQLPLLVLEKLVAIENEKVEVNNHFSCSFLCLDNFLDSKHQDTSTYRTRSPSTS